MAQKRSKRGRKDNQKGKPKKTGHANLNLLLTRGLRNHQAGSIDQAILVYRQILETWPDNADTNHLLGVALHQSGNPQAAVPFIAKAIKSDPARAAFHSNLGNALKDLARSDEAIASYRRALEVDQGFADAHINLGNALNELNRYDEAGPHLRQAIKLKPDMPEAHNNLGLMLHEGQSLLPDAIASFNQALSLRPDFAQAHYNLGNVFNQQGRLDLAVECYGKALQIEPGYTRAHGNLGNVYKEQGRLDAAADCFEKALDIDPGFEEMHLNLGLTFSAMGRSEEAFERLRKNAIEFPDPERNWIAWAQVLPRYAFSSVDDDLLGDLLRLLDHDNINPRPLVRPLLHALRQHPVMATLDLQDYGGVAKKLSAIPLLIKLMGLCHLDDLRVEKMLTTLRRAMVLTIDTPSGDPTGLPFAAALALQCHANDYVYQETNEEKNAVEGLEQDVESLLHNDQDVPPVLIAALAAYRPLNGYPWAEKLRNQQWPDSIKAVIVRQVTDPHEEQALGRLIPALTSIEDGTSRQVRDQYETSPYPRWVKAGATGKGKSVGRVLRDMGITRNWAGHKFADSPDILIAGCGTGQHSIISAARFARSRVLAVDLSRNSLAYAARKIRQLGLTNIDTAQGDILELGSIDRQFDLIECGGVLHHLRDPLAGWRTLSHILRPGGLMMIALYSKLARRHITGAQAFIAARGFPATTEGIRDARRHITEMSEDANPEVSRVTNFTDFYSLNECRDLLFHVQEHLFTLPQIEQALNDLDLQFLGFDLSDQATLQNFHTAHPEADSLTTLSKWHEFERHYPDTFAGMYQFWCYKKTP